MTTPYHRFDKKLAIRHGHGSRRGCNAAEKAIETRVRQDGHHLIAHGFTSRCPECRGVLLSLWTRCPYCRLDLIDPGAASPEGRATDTAA